jgi:BirA family biotin operon repressor/biotin-[acetyl-CoA-carboxylase] ligase
VSSFDIERFQRARQSGWLGRSTQAHGRIRSTMDVAFEDAKNGASHGHIVVADEQSAARGSHGRTWVGTGHLTFSLILRVELPPAACPPLTLAAGLGVADCVEALVEQSVRIKWPNDVLVADQKIAGILSETRGDCIVVGIGLNIVEDPFLSQFSATSLAGCGALQAREDVLALLCSRLETRFDTHLQTGAAATANALEVRLAWRGELVTCGGHAGRLIGVADDGRVILGTVDGERKVSSGTLKRET